jgi:FtsH-binding integral membrane protein
MLVLPYLLRIWKVSTNVYNVAGVVLVLTLVFCWLVSLVTKQEAKADPVVVSKEMLYAPHEGAWYSSVVFWAVIMVAAYMAIYIYYW